MEKPRWWLIRVTLMMGIMGFCLIGQCKAIESPEYSVVHSESEFEVRFYADSVWMTAATTEISFHQATRDGFHRLFQYIQGANLNSSRIYMTAPVLTSIVPEAGPLHAPAYSVRFYLPQKFRSSPPLPLPELNLVPDTWTSHCIAVRKFSGFARDRNVAEEAEKLATSLSKSPWANSTSYSRHAYSIAQYNSPFRFIGRVNEVWVEVVGSEANGCNINLLASS